MNVPDSQEFVLENDKTALDSRPVFGTAWGVSGAVLKDAWGLMTLKAIFIAGRRVDRHTVKAVADCIDELSAVWVTDKRTRKRQSVRQSYGASSHVVSSIGVFCLLLKLSDKELVLGYRLLYF